LKLKNAKDSDRRVLLSGIILEISQEAEEAHFWSLFLPNSKELF
jgi:hypothetical protein